MKKNEIRKGFTLAETMIVLVILGIIASITIPAVVRRQIEAQNRARIKKAMTVYDTAISKIVVENQLKSDDAIYKAAPKNNCILTSQYFKAVENVEENGNQNLCKFKSADGVWWDISDILNPVIGLKRDDLTDVNSNTRFNLLSHFDKNGSLRVDDFAYEQTLPNNSDNIKALANLYAFIDGKKLDSESNEESLIYGLKKCSESSKNKNGDYVNCYNEVEQEWGLEVSVYDENGYSFTGDCADAESIFKGQCLISPSEPGDYEFKFGGQTYDCSNSAGEFTKC